LSNLNEERDVVDKSNWYFTDETEEAIVQYNKRLSKCCNAEIRFEKTVIDGEKNIEKYICSLCGKELEENESYYELSERQRDDLFRSKIYKPFEKLAQSLIYTYEFFYFGVPPADVIKEVVSVLCTKMYRYHQDEGRAFSFFSVIAKRYLINNNNRNYKYYISHSSIDSYTEKQKDFKMANVFDKMDKNTDPEIIKDNQKIINRLVDYLENNIDKYSISPDYAAGLHSFCRNPDRHTHPLLGLSRKHQRSDHRRRCEERSGILESGNGHHGAGCRV